MITNIDENLGILREKLEELGLEDNTILIFMTDNGSSAGVNVDRDGFMTAGYNAGMRGKKGSEYNGGHRVPFFIHWPEGKITTDRDVGHITSYTDVLPTLIDLCGFESPEVEFDGRSIMPLLTGEAEEWPERIIITDTQREDDPLKWKKCAIMTDSWHLIRGEELFNMDSDPGQTLNVADQYPEIVEQLREAYEAWWEAISGDFEDYCEIIINTDKENPFCITAHDWHSRGLPPWNQGHIRSGHPGNGFWVLDVAQTGVYEFALRRWPLETALPLNASLPPGEAVRGEHLSLKGCPSSSPKPQSWPVRKNKPAAVDPDSAGCQLHLQPGARGIQNADLARRFRGDYPWSLLCICDQG